MGGGLMQLVAYGAQDVYLTGNPQITFFKVVYRRHTNFSMESIEQVFTGNVNFGKKTSCTIARNGDLLGKMYLEMDITATAGNLVARPGHACVDYVEVEIGGQAIDKQYGEWMDIWAQLSHSSEQFEKLDRLVSGKLVNKNGGDGKKLYVPLQFWFNRNPGLALPLIALQYHEVKLNIQLHKDTNLSKNNNKDEVTLNNICLFCDYIFLDTDERRRFAQVSHEYLIEQVQFNGKNCLGQTDSCANVELRFNHPCKELVWVVQDGRVRSGGINEPFAFAADSGNGQDEFVKSAVLQLNGHDRFREREGTYFRCVQPYQHHTGGHDQQGNSSGVSGVGGEKGFIYSYSFALRPEDHQPSGTCNFSRIDNALLTLNLASSADAKGKEVRTYATNYNVLRIMSGMGGLAYSN
jgi:hypothetical protein